MEKYLGVKIISARPMNRKEYNDYRGWELPSDENGSDEGMLVEYEDGGQSNHPNHKGYISWSPKEVFEKAYRPITGMTFGLAIEALKLGKRVSRAGWNGKGMYLWLKDAQVVKLPWVRDQNLADTIRDNGFVTAMDDNDPELGNTKAILAIGTICMFTHDSTGRKAVLTGWLASQSDILSEDWRVLE